MTIVHGDPRADGSIAEGVGSGELRRITRGIYTDEHDQPIGAVCRRQWREIVTLLHPGAVLVDSSALACGPVGGHLFIEHFTLPNVTIPGLRIHVRRGPGPRIHDTQLTPRLWRSGPGRIVLDHVRHELGATPRSAGRLTEAELVGWLTKLIEAYGFLGRRWVTDQARAVAERTGTTALLPRAEQLIQRSVPGVQPPRPAQPTSLTQVMRSA
jgi:hypothetical protein